MRGKLMAPRFLFTYNVHGLLVRSESEVNRVAHFAGAGPFGEFNLRHQLRLDPGGNGFILRLHTEG